MTNDLRPVIDYYFWLASDWSYLGSVRFAQLATRHDARVNFIPFRLAEVYAGSGGIPLKQRSWQRQAYRIQELERWSKRLGIPVNLDPRHHPVDIDLASCMVIAAQRDGTRVTDFVNAAMEAIWVHDRDVADPKTLIDLAAGVGLDGPALLRHAEDEGIRAEFAGNSARALDAGVFGSPTYVCAGNVFWGQDRLEMLDDVLIRGSGRHLGRRPEVETR